MNLIFKHKDQYKKNLQLALPVMIGSLGHVLVGVADSVMVGQFLGPIPLAAVSLANSVFHIPLVFAIGVAFGLTPLIANADGEGNIQRISTYWKNGSLINIIFSILILMILILSAPLLHHMKQDAEVVDSAMPYFYIICSGIIPLMLFLNLKQFAEGLSDTIAATRISLGANVVNVALNYFLIKGIWIFPELGLEGAGWATVISRWLMFFGLWIYIRKKDKFKVYWEALKTSHYNWDNTKDILNIGVPSGLQYIFEVGAFAFSAIMIGSIGPYPQAAHQIAISLASISYMAASGLSSAASIRVGNQLGRKDYETLRLAGNTLFQMVIVFMGFTGIIFLLGRNILPTFFTGEEEVILIAANLLIITTIFQISDGVQVVAQGALRGLSDTRMPTLITFIAYWLIALPLAYFNAFILDWGAVGIWIALAIGLTVSGLLLSLRFMKKSKALIAPAIQ